MRDRPRTRRRTLHALTVTATENAVATASPLVGRTARGAGMAGIVIPAETSMAIARETETGVIGTGRAHQRGENGLLLLARGPRGWSSPRKRRRRSRQF